MKITKEERILRVVNDQGVDYLPSNIIFADRSRYRQLSEAFGLSSVSELDDYLENHVLYSQMLQDKAFSFGGIDEEIKKLQKMDFVKPDWENDVLYDNWGFGVKVDNKSGGIFPFFHPLQGKAVDHNIQFMSDNLHKDIIFSRNIAESVKKYKAPDIYKTGNFYDWEEDLKKYSGKYLVLPAGYTGIFERSAHLMGWEEFMINLTFNPIIVEELMSKVTEYKIKQARKIIEMGFKIAHYGEDLGTQDRGLVSYEMFKKIILPHIKRLWEIFNNAGIPIMLHSCGNIIQYIPDLINIGLRILEPVQPCMNLEFLKKEYSRDLVLFGGIDTQVLPFINPIETKELVSKTINILGRGGGYIIGPSQEIMNDIPLDNIVALVETIREERTKIL